MNASLISVRYAKALFQIGLADPQMMEKLRADSTLLISVMDDTKLLDQLMSNATISNSKKLKVVDEVFKPLVDKTTLRFIELVINNERSHLLKSMLVNFLDLQREHAGIKKVTLITAFSLSEKEKENIQLELEQKFKASIDLTLQKNEEIIGGMIVIVDGKQVDSSITGQLRMLKKTLLVN